MQPNAVYATAPCPSQTFAAASPAPAQAAAAAAAVAVVPPRAERRPPSRLSWPDRALGQGRRVVPWGCAAAGPRRPVLLLRRLRS